jgi:hypothetical protein
MLASTGRATTQSRQLSSVSLVSNNTRLWQQLGSAPWQQLRRQDQLFGSAPSQHRQRNCFIGNDYACIVSTASGSQRPLCSITNSPPLASPVLQRRHSATLQQLPHLSSSSTSAPSTPAQHHCTTTAIARASAAAALSDEPTRRISTVATRAAPALRDSTSAFSRRSISNKWLQRESSSSSTLGDSFPAAMPSSDRL